MVAVKAAVEKAVEKAVVVKAAEEKAVVKAVAELVGVNREVEEKVMERVVAMLEERRDLGEPTAQKWLPLMKRKTVKRPVMTLPYGATKQGFADQIMEDTLRRLSSSWPRVWSRPATPITRL